MIIKSSLHRQLSTPIQEEVIIYPVSLNNFSLIHISIIHYLQKNLNNFVNNSNLKGNLK